MVSQRPDSQGMKRLNDNRTPLRRAGWAALVYLIAGFAWIAFSDTLAETWFPDPKTLSVIQTWKGSFFVLITGVILFSVLLRQLTKDRALLNLQHRQRQALRKRERQLQILMDNLPGMAYRCLYDHDPGMHHPPLLYKAFYRRLQPPLPRHM